MNVILDTNVSVSGVFFGGPPFRILQAWHDHKIHLVVSLEILDEYQRVADVLKE
jgi:predicted nucleic acid-binding protein